MKETDQFRIGEAIVSELENVKQILSNHLEYLNEQAERNHTAIIQQSNAQLHPNQTFQTQNSSTRTINLHEHQRLIE